MKLKETVKLADLYPQMVLAAVIVEQTFQVFQDKYSCTITSANDSKHGENSLHYSGQALDFRTKDFSLTVDKQQIVLALKARLGPNFDVLIECIGQDNEHLHVEYDPK